MIKLKPKVKDNNPLPTEKGRKGRFAEFSFKKKRGDEGDEPQFESAPGKDPRFITEDTKGYKTYNTDFRLPTEVIPANKIDMYRQSRREDGFNLEEINKIGKVAREEEKEKVKETPKYNPEELKIEEFDFDLDLSLIEPPKEEPKPVIEEPKVEPKVIEEPKVAKEEPQKVEPKAVDKPQAQEKPSTPTAPKINIGKKAKPKKKGKGFLVSFLEKLKPKEKTPKKKKPKKISLDIPTDKKKEKPTKKDKVKLPKKDKKPNINIKNNKKKPGLFDLNLKPNIDPNLNKNQTKKVKVKGKNPKNSLSLKMDKKKANPIKGRPNPKNTENSSISDKLLNSETYGIKDKAIVNKNERIDGGGNNG